MIVNKFADALKHGMELAKALEEGEPEYHFVKGVGWVSSYEPVHPECAVTLGNWRVKFIQRPVKQGEYFWYESITSKDPIAEVVDAMSNDYWMNIWRVTRYSTLLPL